MYEFQKIIIVESEKIGNDIYSNCTTIARIVIVYEVVSSFLYAYRNYLGKSSYRANTSSKKGRGIHFFRTPMKSHIYIYIPNLK